MWFFWSDLVGDNNDTVVKIETPLEHELSVSTFWNNGADQGNFNDKGQE